MNDETACFAIVNNFADDTRLASDGTGNNDFNSLSEVTWVERPLLDSCRSHAHTAAWCHFSLAFKLSSDFMVSVGIHLGSTTAFNAFASLSKSAVVFHLVRVVSVGTYIIIYV